MSAKGIDSKDSGKEAKPGHLQNAKMPLQTRIFNQCPRPGDRTAAATLSSSQVVEKAVKQVHLNHTFEGDCVTALAAARVFEISMHTVCTLQDPYSVSSDNFEV